MKNLLLISLILLSSCDLRHPEYSDLQIETFKTSIMNNKDIHSYKDYSEYVFNEESGYEILPYAFRMKEVYPDAYLDLFYGFLKVNNKGINDAHNILKLQKPEQDLLIFYLEEGAKKKSGLCIDILIDFYEKGIYFKKSTQKLDSLRFVSDSLTTDSIENPKFE